MRWFLLLLILLGFWWRTPGLFSHTYFADEALFTGWARLIAVWRDPLLTTAAVDKPPLLFYLQALFFPLQGAVPWASRLPNWIASILTIPLTWVLMRRVVPRQSAAALVSGILVVFSPLAVQFSATAFTDPMYLFWIMVAAVLGTFCDNRWGAPAAAGLALWTKYQAIFFFPLVWVLWWSARREKKGGGDDLLLFPAVIGLFAAALVGWDIARSGRFSLWERQMSGFGGVRPVYSWEIWPRLAGIGELSWWIFGVGWLVLVGGAWGWWRLSGRNNFPLNQSPADWWIGLTIFGYLAVHWLLAIPLWDRYWLPLVPWIAIWASGRLFPPWSEADLPKKGRQTVSFLALMIFLLLPQGWQAKQSAFPVGGSPMADGGAAKIAAYLIDKPYGTVLYDHFYSWHWRTAFFDRGVFVSWFPSPDWFGRELQAFGDTEGEKFVVLPSDGRGNPLRRAAADAGFKLQAVKEADEMILYRIER